MPASWRGRWATCFSAECSTHGPPASPGLARRSGSRAGPGARATPEDFQHPSFCKFIRSVCTMATTTATETKTLVNYRVEDGIAVIELNDPPANTYTYEMNRQLDECILKAR